MADYQRIIDEIRFFLQSDDRTMNPQLAELATAYAAACNEANERLRRCGEFLRQGLRSEAIHLAEAEPNVLNLVAALDIPERAQWDEVAGLYGLARPPGLLLDTAEGLNEAYALEQPLEELLREHRLLALGRAPLPRRIATMRRIEQLDPASSVWKDDIRELEKTRFGELQAEAEAAYAKENGVALGSIKTELDETPWSELPPTPLVRYVKEKSTSLVRRGARRWLEPLAGELNEALAALDTSRGRALRHHWNELAKQAALREDEPLLERAREALDWLAADDRRDATEREYADAVRSLDAALDDEAEATELDRLAHAVLKYDRGIPEPVQSRYRARLTSLEAVATRRSRLVMLGAIAGVVIVGGAVAFIIREQVHSADVAKHAKLFEEMLEAGKLTEARQFLAPLAASHPRVAQSATIVALSHRLEAAEKEESDRASRFGDAIAAATNALNDAGATAFAGVEPSALKTARSLARLPQETAAVERLAGEFEAGARKAQAERDRVFNDRVRAVSPRIQQLEKRAAQSLDSAEVTKLLSELQTELAQLARVGEGVTPEVRQQGELLSKRLAAISQAWANHQRQLQLEARLTAAAASAATYAQAAEEYVKEFPDSARALDIKRALKDQGHWQAVGNWNRIVNGWGGPLTRVETRTAKPRTEECKTLLKSYPGTPDAATIRECSQFLEAVARREDAEGGANAEVQKLFADFLIAQVQMLKTTAGQVYYFTKELRSEGDGTLVGVTYLAGFDGKEKRALFRAGAIASSGPSPQSILAADVRKRLLALTDSGWEDGIIAVAEQVRQKSDLDPLLQVILLDRVFQCAMKGSYPLSLALAKHRQAIRNANLDLNVAWFDPNDQEAQRSRPLAAEAVRNIPDLGTAREAAAQHAAGLEQALTCLKQPIGWLAKDASGRWDCRLRSRLEGSYDLSAVIADAENAGRWQQIGTVKDGVARIDSPQAEALGEGRLVFASRTTAPPPAAKNAQRN